MPEICLWKTGRYSFVLYSRIYIFPKRWFFEWHSLKRPVYTLKLDNEGKIVHDKNGILVVLVNSYVQGELKTTKQLLYREAVDGVLSSLHYIKGVLGEDTCLLGGVNALSRLFSPKYVFKGVSTLLGPSWPSHCGSSRYWLTACCIAMSASVQLPNFYWVLLSIT